MTTKSLPELGRLIQSLYGEVLAILSNEAASGASSPFADLENEQQKFQLWCVNLGVFDYGHAALDYRLQDAIEARDLISELLEELIDHLEESKLSYCAQVPNADTSQLELLLVAVERHSRTKMIWSRRETQETSTISMIMAMNLKQQVA
jgi:hypothetical protein